MSTPLVSVAVRYLPGAGQITSAYALTPPADLRYSSRAAIAAVNANLQVLPMGQVGEPGGGPRFRGVRITPFGRGSNDQTFDFRAYAVHCGPQGWDGPVELRLLATVACTLANALASAGAGLESDDRIVDTITVTASAYLTALASAMNLTNSNAAFSPANDTQGCLWIPDLGNADGILFDTDLGTAAGANFLVQRDI